MFSLLRLVVVSILSVLGVIFLGALGSGVWDLALKPGTLRIQKGLLNLRASTARDYKNSVYRNIAKGFHKHPSVHNFMFSHSFMVVSSMAGAVLVLFLRCGAGPERCGGEGVWAELEPVGLCRASSPQQPGPGIDSAGDAYQRESRARADSGAG